MVLAHKQTEPQNREKKKSSKRPDYKLELVRCEGGISNEEGKDEPFNK